MKNKYFQLGPNSGLHIIIFDEIDAICKSRGSVAGNTGVHDTVVNQLLAKIDGVEQLNNILVIGMTNRRDMIDEALLRPGRLEVMKDEYYSKKIFLCTPALIKCLCVCRYKWKSVYLTNTEDFKFLISIHVE